MSAKSWMDKPMREWQRQPVVERILMCERMLYVHGLLTGREHEACRRRIRKLYLKVNREVSRGA